LVGLYKASFRAKLEYTEPVQSEEEEDRYSRNNQDGASYGIFGGFTGSLILGISGIYLLQVKNIPFFIAASEALVKVIPLPASVDTFVLSHPTILGWGILIFAGLTIGALFGASLGNSTGVGRAMGLGFVLGIVTWGILFMPSMIFLVRILPASVSLLLLHPTTQVLTFMLLGLFLNLIFGMFLGGVVGALMPVYRLSERSERQDRFYHYHHAPPSAV
jgi:hypothetical protein